MSSRPGQRRGLIDTGNLFPHNGLGEKVLRPALYSRRAPTIAERFCFESAGIGFKEPVNFAPRQASRSPLKVRIMKSLDTNEGRKSTRELTLRAVFLGAILSIVMGAANVYLGLRAGMTVTASIPAAVVAMVLLRRVLRGGTILESNQVQTAASAGESLAAGIIFTVPALVMLNLWEGFDYWRTSGIALAGGILGVLFMIPMRKVFIAGKEEGLTFPEGVACASVLQAGEDGATARAGARGIALGALVGAGIKLGESTLGFLKGSLEGAMVAGSRIWYFGTEALPALVGVGFIIRLNIAGSLFLGASLAWLIGLPLLSGGAQAGEEPAVAQAYAIWSTQIRYVGVGAMLVGGILTVWRVRHGLVAAVALLRERSTEIVPEQERSLSAGAILVSCAAAIGLTALLYADIIGNLPLTLLTTLVMVVAGFFFTAVASYIVGLVGNSNSPVSGMTITAVLFAGGLFLLAGFEGREGMMAMLGVAAVVCCIACTSGDVCNDLKTGHIVGASPYRQQIMQILGVGVAAFVLSPVLHLLHTTTSGGIGGPNLPAPQAALFASLARAFFGDLVLDWWLVGGGAVLGVVIALVDTYILERRGYAFRAYLMPVAVGMYLPFGISAAIFFGGLLAWWAERGHSAEAKKQVHHRGLLFASGLIAGESLLGIALAVLVLLEFPRFDPGLPEFLKSVLTLAALGLCARLLLRQARFQ
jgi:putative OPT family oligopeptide transporter